MEREVPGLRSSPFSRAGSRVLRPLQMSCTLQGLQVGQSGPLFPERVVQAAPVSQAGKTTEASVGVPCVRGCGRSSSKSRVWVHRAQTAL